MKIVVFRGRFLWAGNSHSVKVKASNWLLYLFRVSEFSGLDIFALRQRNGVNGL